MSDPNWCEEGNPGVCEELKKLRDTLIAIRTWAKAEGHSEVERIAQVAIERPKAKD